MNKAVTLFFALTLSVAAYSQAVMQKLFPVKVGDEKFDAMQSIYLNKKWKEDIETYNFLGNESSWLYFEDGQDSVEVESFAYERVLPIDKYIQSSSLFAWVNFIKHTAYRVYFRANYKVEDLDKCLEDFDKITKEFISEFSNQYDFGNVVNSNDKVEKLGEYYEFSSERYDKTGSEKEYKILVKYSMNTTTSGTVLSYSIEVEYTGDI